ncbi:MAG: preprotein translocase subunit YajC [Planctomycetota bacterium]|nr:preprotein translocase subunit YajC [Planctomycetota bacterium]
MLPTLASLAFLLQTEGATTDAAEASGLPMWVPLVAMGAIFYFLLIAPERKQRKLRQQVLDELKKDDQVMTTGGIYGRVTKVDGPKVTVQVSDGVRMQFSRQAIQSVMDEDGTPLLAEPARKA